MTFDHLRREYERERIGLALLDHIRRLVRQVVTRYPPTIYAEAGAWDESAVEAATQEFVTESLLAQGQLDYAMAQARTATEFDRLLRHQIRRHMRTRRRRTVIDNLMDRVVAMLGSSTAAAHHTSSPEQLQAAIRRVRLIPREAATGAERAPRVYTDADLARVVDAIALELGHEPTADHARAVLSSVLTAWAPSDLLPLQDDADPDIDRRAPDGGPMMATASISPEDAAVAADLVGRIITRLRPDDVTLLRLKFAGASDADAAHAAGVSRPTIAARKHVLVEAIEADLAGVGELVQRRVLDDLGRWLAVREDR